MTTRELAITKGILDFLHSLEMGQAIESEIHRGVNDAWPKGTPPPSASELSVALQHCDSQEWITGIPSRFVGKMKWNINDAGEAARLEMQ